MTARFPSTRDDAVVLPWHAPVWQQLVELAGTGRLPHALLLEGPSGTGRGSFAAAFSQWLLCEEPTEEAACGVCKSCVLFDSGAHSDLLHLCPEEAGKAIGIDVVRNAINFVTGTASLGERKVLLINPAEAMTTAAFNAFLKCLEEPGAGTHMLLVTTQGFPLPATIRSRCQRWKLTSPSADQASRWLDDALRAEGAAPAPDVQLQLLNLSRGRPLHALALAQSEQLESLLTLDAFARSEGQVAVSHFEAAARQLDPDTLLETLELLVHRWLRGRAVEELRSAGHEGFTALGLLQQLREARRAGTNPNPDLLQFKALNACVGLWER